ncbi:hypothetical protein [Chryseobacterium sp. Hurlbut01]|jgi:hypothetical protein|uniref:hypothetical protein n=1 Tax=Chryseobacterium sp. Hurlbut01 TaxID=1681828 RepID=UPI00067B8E8B|nr:hypothetical protein [Chryseobacterium sp. Hurlbut01]KNB62161.1 hypothetical protein AC804_04570 [Chryseobacterium sp. Hurlbut01]
MKKLILIFLLISRFSFGQFTISNDNWNETGKYFEAVKIYENGEKTKAKIYYLDYGNLNASQSIVNPSQYYEFIFSTEPDTLNKLHKLIIEKLQEKRKQELVLTFPEGNLILDFYAVNFMSFKFENKTTSENLKRETLGLNIKRINKLFGKK